MAEKPMEIFARNRENIRSEEGLAVLPDRCIADIDMDEYDSLLLSGAEDIREGYMFMAV